MAASYYPIVSMTGAEYAALLSSGHQTRRRFQVLQPLSSRIRSNHQQEEEEEEEDQYSQRQFDLTEEALRRLGNLIEEVLAAYTTRGGGGDHDAGLQKEAIAKSLNIYNATNSNSPHVDDDDNICVVCQDSLLFDQQKLHGKKMIASLDCGHNFHAECIESWLLIKNRCPLCNATGIRL